MSKKEATTSGAVIIRTVYLNSKSFCVLFDLGATHSFISTRTALRLSLENDKLWDDYRIRYQMGSGSMSSSLQARLYYVG